MAEEFLSICIPSRNRSHLLRDLLASIASEIKTSGFTPEAVKVYLSDNASTDATRTVALEIMGSLPHFVYSCNETNIGGNANIFLCANTGVGRYRWVLGDDETLTPGSLAYLLTHLRAHEPGWFIHSTDKPLKRLQPPRTFSNANEFLRAAAECEPEALMAAGGISFCTFRTDCYDYALAKSLQGKCSYPQLFALLNGLRLSGASVFLTDRATVTVREQRPAPVDPGSAIDSDNEWKQCLAWIKENFDMPELDPETHSRLVSRNLIRQLFRHPITTIRNYAAFLLIPEYYPRMVKRLWYAIKP